MAKNQVIRFAFGTKEEPGSAVWRAVVTKKRGEVFLNNAPEFGNDVHIAIHESGKSHIKLGRAKYYDLVPPMQNPGNGNIWDGPVIFFHTPVRNLPPMKPTGKVSKVKWLGWPEPGHVFLVRTFFCDPNCEIRAESHERSLGGPFDVHLYKKPMRFYLFHEKRKEQRQEWWNRIRKDPEVLMFEGSTPSSAEMLRISKTPQGPSAIIIESFRVEKAMDKSRWPLQRKPE